MSDNSTIEWTNTTWNPTAGCTRASAGCDNCYAVKMTKRLEAMGQAKYAGLVGNGHFNGVVRTWEEALTQPLSWKKPRKVFVNSMSDLFHKDVPFEFIDRVFAVMALTPQHTYQVLTKRPDIMSAYMNDEAGSKITEAIKKLRLPTWMASIGNGLGKPSASGNTSITGGKATRVWPLPNVWLGTSCENQKAADKRIPHLLRCPAAVRFISAEPLLGPLDINAWMVSLDGFVVPDWPSTNTGPIHVDDGGVGIDWIIVGGEPGPNDRPCNIEWIRGIVKQCEAAEVACFVKQLGRHVIDRNDRGFDADEWFVENNDGTFSPYQVDAWPSTVCVEHNINGFLEEYQGAPVRVHLTNKKGGDPSQWPADLRVRQFPTEGATI